MSAWPAGEPRPPRAGGRDAAHRDAHGHDREDGKQPSDNRPQCQPNRRAGTRTKQERDRSRSTRGEEPLSGSLDHAEGASGVCEIFRGPRHPHVPHSVLGEAESLGSWASQCNGYVPSRCPGPRATLWWRRFRARHGATYTGGSGSYWIPRRTSRERSVPASRATRWRAMSIPAEMPAAVITSPSSTNRSVVETWTVGSSLRRSSSSAQWVVARRL